MKNIKFLKKFALSLILVLTLTALCFTVNAAAVSYIIDGDNACIAGDADGNGTVDVLDLVKAAVFEDYLKIADVNGNGEVDAADLSLIRSEIIGVDESQWTE
ncbi:MAG: dockerin type I repeat-containing protein [Clostridia bacterium]|nr:dockerin type I repeat-containing protein [Clostridia bacterium]